VRTGQILDASKITVAQYLDRWLASKRGLRVTTVRSYEGHIRVYLRPLVGAVPLTALRADHLDRMYEAIRRGEIRKPPGAATIRRIHSTLRIALNDAVRRRMIAFNPASQVELEPEPLREREVWTPEQLAEFIDATNTDRIGAVDDAPKLSRCDA
jgi:hypothetical protein